MSLREGGSSPQVENQAERVVYRSQLVKGKVSHVFAEASCVDRAYHLAQHPGELAFDRNLGMEARRCNAH